MICTEVLEHVPGDFDVIERFTPGVRALCTVPNFPYDSHVRHFKSAESVRERYGRFFDDLDVWALGGFWDPSRVYYLMDGVRKRG